MNQETNQTKRIEAYAIADFVKQVQEAVLEGYKINLEDNEKYPLQIGVGFYATMDKKGIISEVVRQAIIQDAQEITKEHSQEYSQTVKRGRQHRVS